MSALFGRKFKFTTVIQHFKKGRCPKARGPKGNAWCAFVGLLRTAFKEVYDPDYDAAHRDHIHMQVPK